MTGRPSLSAILAATISWLKGSLLPPKPPPFGQATTRMRDAGNLQHLGERAVDVVRRLRRRVDGHAVVVLGHRYRRVLLHRQVGVAVVEEDVLEDLVGRREPGLQVAELQRHPLVDVAAVAVVVDARLGGGERLLDRGDGGERLVLDAHGERRLPGGVLGRRRHRHHRVADEADALGAEGVLVLRHRQDAEGDGEVFAGEEAEHSRHLLRGREVDAREPRVRHGRAHQAQKAHAGEEEVVGEFGDAGHLSPPVHATERLADEGGLALAGGLLRRAAGGLGHRAQKARVSRKLRFWDGGLR